ncbi:hypothetical protein KSP40_PGU009657 [Platanthera guangdongensis]|uniref:Uncharacterized protein n=1 Tax=Platanthera guangdongensis TaxID=2320717 RepID=A0ABR2M2R1_9ASPA
MRPLSDVCGRESHENGRRQHAGVCGRPEQVNNPAASRHCKAQHQTEPTKKNSAFGPCGTNLFSTPYNGSISLPPSSVSEFREKYPIDGEEDQSSPAGNPLPSLVPSICMKNSSRSRRKRKDILLHCRAFLNPAEKIMIEAEHD